MNNKNIVRTQDDVDWGCYHDELTSAEVMVKICVIRIKTIKKIAEELTRIVLNKSWMMDLDARTQRCYRYTVEETSKLLVDIFNKIKAQSSSEKDIGVEFGEIMVSMGASRALNKLFNHISLPIAELWKPQKKQNEGFDFHTVCPKKMVNFGEAKYSGISNPHGDALTQIIDFINVEKHLRDVLHLEKLAGEEVCDNLDNECFGVVAAFSINSENYDLIIKNALESVKEKNLLSKCSIVYLVGVICK
ncbi:hypothetical protein ACJYFV_00380 [Enterobacter asburiae]|nr:MULTISPECIES: hypothetical protein [Enterobacter cloacae complex]SAG32387.1 Uncharacterised protein [Enterobacter cloacae]ASD57114.1 hypothetical protein WM95_00575 [Enterobacter cloacae complex sp. ECNIH7]KVJ90934.1 hypothetical protein AWS24_13365 [Enterobacter asburiae]KZP86556.1 hypothetical protein A3N46_04115 [Enterobacter asburiae]MBJ3797184.1 hypothetical protein [Enterobacter asburiae]